MAHLKNDRGMTFVSILFSLTIILLCIPLLISILHLGMKEEPYVHHSVNQFFYSIRNELLKAKEAKVVDNTLYIRYFNNNLITISKHRDVIRRQVFHTGHEILLRDVKQFEVKENSFGFFIVVDMKTGDRFEKSFTVYE